MGTDKKDTSIVVELSSGALHSLNNLLQGIMGLAELLSSNPNLPEDAKMDAQGILEIAEDASKQIRKLRESTKTAVAPEITEFEIPKPKEPSGKNRADIKILVAEDDPLVLNVVVGMLKALGYVAIPTTDGVEAREKYKEVRNNVSLVIADLVMPRLGGLQLAEELLIMNPEVKIIVMTGYIREELDINPEEFGLAGWLEKPMNAARLEQVIKSVVGV
jgi:CheY-like chemotaxis protein